VSAGRDTQGSAGRRAFAPGEDPRDFDVRSTIAGEHPTLVIEVKGELSLERLGRVRVAADLAIDARRPVVLDLSECPFIDSAGLGLVLDIDRELAYAGTGRLAVVIGNMAVLRAFSVSGVDRRVPVCSRLDEALALVGHESPAS
jgi:anti-anti-sigma factor